MTSDGTTIYVADPGNGRIVRFDPAGNVVGIWTMPSYTIVANGQTFNGRIEPHDVAVDGSGRVFAPDSGPHSNLVVVFGSDGGLQQVLGSPDSDPGNACALRAPWGVAVSGSTLYVVSTGENRIRVFDDAAAPCPAVNFGAGGGLHPGGPDRRRPKVKLQGLPKKCARRNFTLRIHATDDVQLRRFILLVNRRKVANQAVNKQTWNVRVNFPVRKVRSQLPRGASVSILIEVRVADTAGKKSRVRRTFRICG
jgi:DNA-binding beta-propeller fold protein YncE